MKHIAGLIALLVTCACSDDAMQGHFERSEGKPCEAGYHLKETGKDCAVLQPLPGKHGFCKRFVEVVNEYECVNGVWEFVENDGGK